MTLTEILGAPINREEALDRIKSSKIAYEIFKGFSEKNQENILGFIQGVKGLPILYDGFYKYVFDPERHPERLEDFLSELFGQKVHIEQVLAKEGNKLSEESSLVVLDIIVRLSDGSIVDVEMQKHGYLFTGERSSCYMADMIMRQYNRVKSLEQDKFKFSHMKPVYLIILMEKSTKEFKAVAPTYIHRFEKNFDSGVEINLLSNLTYISLDTFREVGENICNKMVAWLTFLSSDEPERMLQLVGKYPEFIECYHDIMEFRKKPEELITMFSEALIQMDKNTVKYMIEEQQRELEENKKRMEENQKVLEENQKVIKENQKVIKEKDKEIEALRAQLEELKKSRSQK